MKLIFLFLLSLMTQVPSNEVKSGVYAWSALPVKISQDRESRKIMEGTSPHFEFLEMHATTQAKGAAPGRPHAQQDKEEVIIVKEGTMRFTIDEESAILGPGSVILVPPRAMQSLENIGDGPLTYYVMVFRSKKPMNITRGQAAGGKLLLNADSLEFRSTTKGGRISYFDRPTAMCGKFEIHVTQLNQKGPSHEPHAHVDSEITLVIEGETEMTIEGEEYKGVAGDIYFMKSDEKHGIRNASDKSCKYFAIRWRE
ncbi:MAG: cupin domain-containing protein [Cyclobacteriaceae bacterium]|nr:cupin domain-containing protein [Cyclobacteriaceae bacterium]MDH4298928.1 cupin domain-containing protein [Cyclobacteriaceae bacterium]MDH5251566.1 cupin domain-containing protein [Cyclobacteriaceae bacterium]